ncbi:hypothetical protein BDBG_00659 [Blastomyces gilchristii SLH14081]|uniref:Uncharacterized protein n=1 Tax=Blastomyces gilchristii (strain SLH14081) TaxID=559298 RepID=A0A179U7T8_BLAGS|nr:uncharacterized protein BDBG_00659 [Blastomyces gilchristii SLH14081]OAT04024.1 hypothetical protein BDBG_00659 [Blastomyces gilchristii SLH14081]
MAAMFQEAVVSTVLHIQHLCADKPRVGASQMDLDLNLRIQSPSSSVCQIGRLRVSLTTQCASRHRQSENYQPRERVFISSALFLVRSDNRADSYEKDHYSVTVWAILPMRYYIEHSFGQLPGIDSAPLVLYQTTYAYSGTSGKSKPRESQPTYVRSTTNSLPCQGGPPAFSEWDLPIQTRVFQDEIWPFPGPTLFNFNAGGFMHALIAWLL